MKKSVSNITSQFQPYLVTPGNIHPLGSVLLLRLQSLIQFRMPPLGFNVIDQQAIDLIEEWIMSESLSDYLKYKDWALLNFPPDSIDEIAEPDLDPDKDSIPNHVEFLMGFNPLEEEYELKINYLAYPETQTIELKYYSRKDSDKKLMRRKIGHATEAWESVIPKWESVRELNLDWLERKLIIDMEKDGYMFTIQ